MPRASIRSLLVFTSLCWSGGCRWRCDVPGTLWHVRLQLQSFIQEIYYYTHNHNWKGKKNRNKMIPWSLIPHKEEFHVTIHDQFICLAWVKRFNSNGLWSIQLIAQEMKSSSFQIKFGHGKLFPSYFLRRTSNRTESFDYVILAIFCLLGAIKLLLKVCPASSDWN